MGLLAESVRALVPERKAAPAAIGATIPTWEFGNPQQQPNQSFGRLASQGYMLDEIAFACVEALATSASEPRMAAYRLVGSGEEKVEQHPALTLLNHPNPFLDGALLWASIQMYLAIGGNAYLEKVRSASGKLVELWLLRPDRVRVIPDARRFVGGYSYTIGDDSYTLPPEDVIHFKSRHPLDDFYGLAPLSVLAGRVDLDVWARQFTEAFFRNAGVPAGLLNIQRQVSDQEREMIRQRFRQQYGGPAGWHQLMVIDGGEASYTQMGMAANQGNITDSLDQANEARICMAFGVPPTLISARVGMASSSYANRRSDRELFWQGTLAPIYRYLAAKLTSGLRAEYPDLERFEHDLSTVQALQEDQDAKFTRWLNVLEHGACTREEFRLEVGLPEEPNVVGTYLISTRVIPTPSDMPALGIPPGLTPLEAGKVDDAAANVAELTDEQRGELAPSRSGKALPTGG